MMEEKSRSECLSMADRSLLFNANLPDPLRGDQRCTSNGAGERATGK
jgi:hypothetical protein